MDVVRALADARLFATASPAEVAEVAALATTRRLVRGQLLFREGEAGDVLYVVATGRLKIVVTGPSGDELVLAVLGPGDSVGELSVLDGQPRSATAQALEDAVLVAVAAPALRALVARCPELALAWAQELAATVRRLSGVTADLVFLDLPRRLAKLLLGSGGEAVDLGMSQRDVAARLGVARQSLNRALSHLQHRGWVRVVGTHVVLRDRPALQRFVTS